MKKAIIIISVIAIAIAAWYFLVRKKEVTPTEG